MGSRLTGIAAGLAAAVAWSSAGLFIKKLDLPPIEIALLRSAFAALFFGLAGLGAGPAWRLCTWESWAAAFSVGATVVLFVIATKWTSAAAAIFLQSTAPTWVLVLGLLLFGRRPGRRDVLAVLGCGLGMSLFFVGRWSASGLAGNVVALVAGLFFGLHMLTMREVPPKARMPVLAVGNLAGVAMAAALAPSAAAYAPGAPVAPLAWPNLNQLAAVAYLGIGQIGVGYWLFTQAIARLPAIEAALLSLLEPLLNPLWVYLGVGELPGPYALAGGAIVLGTVAWHTLHQRAWCSSASPGSSLTLTVPPRPSGSTPANTPTG